VTPGIVNIVWTTAHVGATGLSIFVAIHADIRLAHHAYGLWIASLWACAGVCAWVERDFVACAADAALAAGNLAYWWRNRPPRPPRRRRVLRPAPAGGR
jgi:hypothetical protein